MKSSIILSGALLAAAPALASSTQSDPHTGTTDTNSHPVSGYLSTNTEGATVKVYSLVVSRYGAFFTRIMTSTVGSSIEWVNQYLTDSNIVAYTIGDSSASVSFYSRLSNQSPVETSTDASATGSSTASSASSASSDESSSASADESSSTASADESTSTASSESSTSTSASSSSSAGAAGLGLSVGVAGFAAAALLL